MIVNRKKKNMFRQIRKFLKKHINGAKGAVSLLLVFVMSPLLSIALLLVESARYQNAVQLMEEITDSSGFSVLADYDNYLDERFGLLSVSQENNISASFSDYLGSNIDALGNSIALGESSASGKYALSDTDVLKQQMLEYSEIPVAAEVLTEVSDLENLIDEIKESFNIDELEKQTDSISAAIDITNDLASVIKDIDKAKEKFDNEYSPALTKYQEAYEDFAEKAEDLITALGEAEENLEEGEASSQIYEEEEVDNALTELQESRDTYKTATLNLKTELLEMEECLEGIVTTANNLPSKLQETEGAVSDANDAGKVTYDWETSIAEEIRSKIGSLITADFHDRVATEAQALEDQAVKLGNLEDTTITSEWAAEKVEKEYGRVSISSLSTSFSTRLGELRRELDEQANVSADTTSSLESLLNVANALMGIQGLYDANLDSNIDTSYFYKELAKSGYAESFINSMKDLTDASGKFISAIKNVDILGLLGALGDLLSAIVNFLAAIIGWIGNIGINTINLLGDPSEWYNKLLLCGYAAYNLPNRTNYTSGESVSGYSFNQIYELAGGKAMSPSLSHSLNQLEAIGNGNGSDRLFKGAETEYILAGSSSEIENQSAVFFNSYMFRLVLDLMPVLKNTEVSALAASAGPGAWLVKFLVVLAEPMLDTIILVNGGSEYLIKNTVYISPSGISALLDDIKTVSGFSDAIKDDLGNVIKDKVGTPEKKGIFEADYTEHLLFLLLLTVPEQDCVMRMQNIIQIEAAENYRTEYEFELDRAYTFLQSDVTYTLNPMFNIDSLTENGLFTVSSKQYTGY